MKNKLCCAVLFVVFAFAKAQTQEMKPPSDFFLKEKAQVLVVGTFHLDYPGLDSHKTTDDQKIVSYFQFNHR